MLKRFRRRKRPLRALQLEVTSRCTRRCAICPRSVLSDTWCEGDLDDAVWKRLEPDLTLAEHVHLQGWGEPLLHPALSRWARVAQEAGCTVGMTTNGDHLEPAMKWLKQGTVDRITISVAGDARTHSALRDGSRLDQVLETAGDLSAFLQTHGVQTKIQMSYLLTRHNATFLPAVVEQAAGAGLAEVFVTHLECRPSLSFIELSAFTGHGLLEELALCLDEAEKTASRIGIPYRGPARVAEELLICALNPLRFAFVGWDGRVAPCVNLLLPVKETLRRWNEEGEHQIEPFLYGRLQDAPLSELLVSSEFRWFNSPFTKRLAIEKQFVASLDLDAGANALKALNEADEQRTSGLSANPFPDACTACPKVQGW